MMNKDSFGNKYTEDLTPIQIKAIKALRSNDFFTKETVDIEIIENLYII